MSPSGGTGDAGDVSPPAVLALRGVTVRHGDRAVLDRVDWTVVAGERWIVLGANGSGKTTLTRVASLRQHPGEGEVEVLGERLGRTDVRALRARVALVSASFADLLRPRIVAADVVMTAKHGALEPWWHTYTDDDRRLARALLTSLGCGEVSENPFGTLSSGERQRVQLARALMAGPELVLLDEPMAGLDLRGREELVATLADLAARPDTPSVVLVTHHVDEIPPGFDRALLLRDGRVTRAGPLDEVLTATNLSELFDLPLELERREGRWQARAVPRG